MNVLRKLFPKKLKINRDLLKKMVTVIVPSCPKCNAPMVKRTAKHGRHRGDEFWGCSTYPQCKGLRIINNDGTPESDYDWKIRQEAMAMATIHYYIRNIGGWYDDDWGDMGYPGHPSEYGDQ